MRVRFWRKKKVAPVFDPDAGEIPEFLDVYPQGNPFPWRRTLLSAVTIAVVVTGYDAYREYRNREPGSGALVIVEGAPLNLVCGEPRTLQSLYQAAPCDEEAMRKAGIDGADGYYFAFAVRLRNDGNLSNRRPYLFRNDCIMDRREVLSPVDACVVMSLE